MKRFLDENELTGMKSYHEYDHSTGETRITYEFDTDRVEAILDANKKLYNDGTNGYKSKAREWKHVANIPHEVELEWFTKHGININNKDHWPAVRRLLNSSEYLYLRTSPGRI